MGLKEVGERLPPGYRFYPSDEELVCYYLYNKITNEESINGTLVDIDLHSCEPWQLPEVAKLSGSEWYFFTYRDRKYTTGFRTNRATKSGYWKATGKDRPVFDPNTRENIIVGMRKTLVFYRNRAPNGIKSGWIMHEFRLESPPMPPKEDWVLCRVFHKSNRDNNTSITHMGLSNLLDIIESPIIMPIPPPPPPLSNEEHIPTSKYSISSTNNNSNNIGNTNNITHKDNNDDGNNSYVIVSRNKNNEDDANILNNNDNMSSSSSLNPTSDNDHHYNNNNSNNNNEGSSFSFSELMNEEEEGEYGFLGNMDLLEGTTKFGGGLGYEQDNGSLSPFF